MVKKIISIIFLFLYCISSVKTREEFPLKEMIGEWEGKGKIIVTWCKKKTLFCSLTILPQGKVEGKIGDAEIKEGVIKKNSPILVWLGNPRYIIFATLKGPIVKEENIYRESIKLVVDFEDDKFIGGFHTSGGKFNGKKSMMLSGTELILLRK